MREIVPGNLAFFADKFDSTTPCGVTVPTLKEDVRASISRSKQVNASKAERDRQTAREAESGQQDATDVPCNLCHHERRDVDK